jgi:hypothetical protein
VHKGRCLAQVFSKGKSRIETVLRTFRIPKELNSALESEAGSRGISPNALLSSILTKFANWDRIADTFVRVSVSQELFRNILDHVPNEEIGRMAEIHAGHTMREAMLFWSKELTIDSFLTYVENRCRYAGWGQFERSKEAGGRHVIAIRHHLGQKWSSFLGQCFDKSLRTLGIVTSRFEVSEGLVVASFTE